jgi:hypothetical protein
MNEFVGNGAKANKSTRHKRIRHKSYFFSIVKVHLL